MQYKYISNPYQVKNHIIQYNEFETKIQEFSQTLVEKFQIEYNYSAVNKDLVVRNEANQNCRQQINNIVVHQSKLYFQKANVLFEISFNKFTAITLIPGLKQKNVHSKLCKYNNTLLAANNGLFYQFLDNEFQQTHFYHNNELISPNEVFLYEFNNKSVLCAQSSNSTSIYMLNSPNCQLIYSSPSVLNLLFSTSGFQLYQISESTYVCIDFTHSELQVREFSSDLQLQNELLIENGIFLEYKKTTMNLIIPDYEQFIIRRDATFNELTKQIESAELDDVIDKFYPTINPRDYVFQNWYQLENRIIFYLDQHAYITDLEYKVIARVVLQYKYNSLHTSNRIHKGHYSNFHKLHYCNGKVYILLDDILFRVEVFKLIEMAKIPGQYNKGYIRISTYKNQVIVTNEHQYYLLDEKSGSFIEKKFYLNGKLIEPDDTGLYSYGDYTTARITSQQNYIVELNEPSCRIIYCGSQISDMVPAGGIFPLSVGNGAYIVIDYTTNPVSVHYCLMEDELSYYSVQQIPFVYSFGHIDYPEKYMNAFTDDNYQIRRQAIYNNLKAQLKYVQIQGINKFQRSIQVNNKLQLQFEDVFKFQNSEFNLLMKQVENNYILKKVQIYNYGYDDCDYYSDYDEDFESSQEISQDNELTEEDNNEVEGENDEIEADHISDEEQDSNQNSDSEDIQSESIQEEESDYF
ncbi:Conserved_hypothetical protein [Hexamita inflata]|uniref:Uncharacterized protein n=1 Tax=Hexamita inflata TaxID=28002 RepID=A0AA86QUA9_9EUKA|nr:Conserved hypothetical protein [Hexamita inflata]